MSIVNVTKDCNRNDATMWAAPYLKSTTGLFSTHNKIRKDARGKKKSVSAAFANKRTKTIVELRTTTTCYSYLTENLTFLNTIHHTRINSDQINHFVFVLSNSSIEILVLHQTKLHSMSVIIRHIALSP